MGYYRNQAHIIGNLAKDVDLRSTSGGNPVATFSVATNRAIKKGDKYETVATFHNIVVWGKNAEWAAKNFSKGDKIAVYGRIDNRSYEKDGVTKYISEIVAEELIPMHANKAKKEKTLDSEYREEEQYDENQDINIDDINLDDILGS